MNWYLAALKNYANFEGRAQRKAFWYFVLFNTLFAIILAILDSALGTFDAQSGWGALGAIYTLAVLLPGIAVAARRLHDIGRSGWWQLIVLVPIIGAILLVVWYCFDSTPGSNKYGPNPKENGAATGTMDNTTPDQSN